MKTLDEYIKIIENIDLEKDKDYQQEDSYEEFFFEKLKHLILADYKNEEANRERRRSERIKP